MTNHTPPIDTASLESWFVCPWCSSDEPTLDPDPRDLSVDHIGGETAFGVRCHSCGHETNWRVTEDGIEVLRDD